MMKRKHYLLFTLIVFVLVSESKAQSIGIIGGMNLTETYYPHDQDLQDNTIAMAGFHFGVTAEYPVFGVFSVEPGILLRTKRYHVDQSAMIWNERVDFKATTDLSYLESTLLLKAVLPGSSVRVYAQTGPYVGCGLSGKSKIEMIIQDMIIQGSEGIRFGSDPESDDLKRFDFGIQFGMGMAIEAMQFGVAYGLGLSNLAADPRSGNILHHRTFNISFTYYIPWKNQSADR